MSVLLRIPDARLLEAPGIDALGASLDALPVDAVIVGGGALDASTAAARLLAATERTAVLVTGSPQRDHPYNLARRIASLAHLSGGRAGWLAVPGDGGGSPWREGPSAAAVLAEAIRAVRALWASWPLDSVIADRARRRFVESDRIRFTEVPASRGPLNVPGPPGGRSPIVVPAGLPAEVGALADLALDAPGVRVIDLGDARLADLGLEGLPWPEGSVAERFPDRGPAPELAATGPFPGR